MLRCCSPTLQPGSSLPEVLGSYSGAFQLHVKVLIPLVHYLQRDDHFIAILGVVMLLGSVNAFLQSVCLCVQVQYVRVEITCSHRCLSDAMNMVSLQ